MENKRIPPFYDLMASGNYSIVLEDGVNYDNFAEIATKWVNIIDLKIIDKIADVGELLWSVKKDDQDFWLAHDNWFPTISLEPKNKDAAEKIFQIGKKIGIVKKEE